MSKLDELKALLEKATAGPWEQTYGHGDSGNNNNVIFGRERPNQYIARIVSGRGNGGEEERHANAQLIALLRNMAPDLLRVVEAAASLHRTIAPVERKMLGERSEDKLGILGNALKALEG